jgi:hypothetical protein
MERPQAIYDIINGKTRSITEKMAIKIISVFSDINKSWLMSGEGAMLTEGPYERMNRILKTEGITQREFEKGTGGLSWFVPGIYSNAQKNPGDPNVLEEWVGAFLKRFPRYSKEWILYGTPPMMIDNKGEVTTFVREMDAGHSVQKVPIFEMEATAGFSALYRDFSSNVSDYITIPNLPPVDGAIFARGDSMSPLIASGDIVIFKKVDLIPENILWGHIYIVSYAVDGDDYTVLKYIRQSQREGYIRLESFNSRFDPQDIPASSITALALVKASITFHTIG